MDGWCKFRKLESANCRTCPFYELDCLFWSDNVTSISERKRDSYCQTMVDRFMEKRQDIYLKHGFNPEWVNSIRYKQALSKPQEQPSEIDKRESVDNENKGIADYDNIASFAIYVFISAVIGVPLAYFGQIFQIFTDFFIGLIGVFIGTEHSLEDLSIPWEENFFYSSFGARYLYWSTLTLTLFVFCEKYDKSIREKEHGNLKYLIECITFVAFLIVAALNINLFISTFIGIPFVILCFLITAKR